MENIAYISFYLSFIVYAFFYFKKSFEIDLKYFLAYLLFNLSFELFASYLKDIEQDNLHIYNILTFFEINFLLYFFKGILESKSTKKNILYIIIIFNIIYFLSSYFILTDFSIVYNSVASISGSIAISVILVYFFKDFLNSDKILNYKKSLSFWIAFGLSIYYLGTIPLTSILNNLKDTPKEVMLKLYNIQYFLTAFKYVCFIFGALWSQKKVR